MVCGLVAQIDGTSEFTSGPDGSRFTLRFAVLPEDGAIDEGYAYWWNGACRALEALDVLRHATGGALDASAVPALAPTGANCARARSSW